MVLAIDFQSKKILAYDKELSFIERNERLFSSKILCIKPRNKSNES